MLSELLHDDGLTFRAYSNANEATLIDDFRSTNLKLSETGNNIRISILPSQHYKTRALFVIPNGCHQTVFEKEIIAFLLWAKNSSHIEKIECFDGKQYRDFVPLEDTEFYPIINAMDTFLF